MRNFALVCVAAELREIARVCFVLFWFGLDLFEVSGGYLDSE